MVNREVAGQPLYHAAISSEQTVSRRQWRIVASHASLFVGSARKPEFFCILILSVEGFSLLDTTCESPYLSCCGL